MSHHYSGADWGFPHGDARLDLTDLYAFPKPGDADKSILIMNGHPSAGESLPGATTAELFAPEALYELKIDTDGDAIADFGYRVRFSSSDGGQSTTLRRVEGAQAAGIPDDGQAIVEGTPSYDPRRPASFPDNRRTLTDDVAVPSLDAHKWEGGNG